MLRILLPAGRPTAQSGGEEPQTLSAACDAGLSFVALQRKTKRTRRRRICRRGPTETKPISWAAKHEWKVEEGDGWVRDDVIENAKVLIANWSTSNFFSLRAVVRPGQHTDVLNADRRFSLVVQGLLDVSVDLNDATITIEENGTRISKITDSSLLLGCAVDVGFLAQAESLTILRNNHPVLVTKLSVLPAGRKIGVVVTNTRCAIESWCVVDHEADAHSTAAVAAKAASDAVRRAFASLNEAKCRMKGLKSRDKHLPSIQLPQIVCSAETRRQALRHDIGLFCDECNAPFTKIGEDLCLWKQRAVQLRFHSSCFDKFVSRGHVVSRDRGSNRLYADSWLRARFDDRTSVEQRRLRYFEKQWRATTVDTSVANVTQRHVTNALGKKTVSAPLTPSTHAALVDLCTHKTTAADGIGAREEECPICLRYCNEQRTLRLPCSHTFHEACLRPWFQRCSLCPTCRTDVRSFLCSSSTTADVARQSERHERARVLLQPSGVGLRPESVRTAPRSESVL